MQAVDVFLLGVLLCSGLSGGIGFLNVLGFVPGMRDTPIIIAYSTNLPANQYIQSLDAAKAPSSPEFTFFFNKAAGAFTLRGYCAMASYVCTMVASYTQFTHSIHYS